ncbi:MAG: hypothetical protein EBU88_11130, partial [Acidobacteria bacterium]|nr:hypothetical protein [Acidobacteriota bacterium]
TPDRSATCSLTFVSFDLPTSPGPSPLDFEDLALLLGSATGVTGNLVNWFLVVEALSILPLLLDSALVALFKVDPARVIADPVATAEVLELFFAGDLTVGLVDLDPRPALVGVGNPTISAGFGAFFEAVTDRAGPRTFTFSASSGTGLSLTLP